MGDFLRSIAIAAREKGRFDKELELQITLTLPLATDAQLERELKRRREKKRKKSGVPGRLPSGDDLLERLLAEGVLVQRERST